MKCSYIKLDNTKCEANTINDSNFCFSHDPLSKESKAMAVRKGGLAPKRVLLDNEEEIVLETASDAKYFLSRVISGVWQGEIPVPIANTFGFLTRCFLESNEQSELEERLQKIEKELENKRD